MSKVFFKLFGGIMNHLNSNESSNLLNNAIHSVHLAFMEEIDKKGKQPKKLKPIDATIASVWISGLERLNKCSAEERKIYNKARVEADRKYPLTQKIAQAKLLNEEIELRQAKDDYLDYETQPLPGYIAWKRVQHQHQRFAPEFSETQIKKMLDSYQWPTQTKIRLIMLCQILKENFREAIEKGSFKDYVGSIPLNLLLKDLPEEEQNLIYYRYVQDNRPSTLDPKWMGIRKITDYDARRVQKPSQKAEVNEEILDPNAPAYFSQSLKECVEKYS